jgi:hypothetical protein
MFNRIYCRQLYRRFQTVFHCKDFWVAATLFKDATVKFQTDASFLLSQESVTFNFLFFWEGMDLIR